MAYKSSAGLLMFCLPELGHVTSVLGMVSMWARFGQGLELAWEKVNRGVTADSVDIFQAIVIQKKEVSASTEGKNCNVMVIKEFISL